MFRTHLSRVLSLLFLATIAFLFSGCDGYREREVRIVVNNRTQDRIVVTVNGESIREIGPGAEEFRVRVPVVNNQWNNNGNFSGPQARDRAEVHVSALNVRTQKSSVTRTVFMRVGEVESVDFRPTDFLR